jgi:hypothetical protein
MDKSTKASRISAAFLAAVLVAGTIALSAPSFMTGLNAQAQPYYGGGMDNSYDKPYGKDNRDKSKDSVNVKKIKCNNINVNVNGIELNVTSFPFLSGIGADDADASDGKYGAGSYGSGGSYDGYSDRDKDGFTFVCINNNNNEAGGGGNVTDGNITDACEECFAQVLNTTELNRLDIALGNGINVTIGTTQVEINSLEELCNVLENVTGGQLLVSIVGEILSAASITLTSAEFFELETCIAAALGIELDPQLPMN